MTEPTHLTYDEFLPLATAFQRRDAYARAGAGLLLPPFPACPTCGQPPTELHVGSDHPAQFLHDRTGFGFRPCGHNFTVDGDDLAKAYGIARQGAP